MSSKNADLPSVQEFAQLGLSLEFLCAFRNFSPKYFNHVRAEIEMGKAGLWPQIHQKHTQTAIVAYDLATPKAKPIIAANILRDKHKDQAINELTDAFAHTAYALAYDKEPSFVFPHHVIQANRDEIKAFSESVWLSGRTVLSMAYAQIEKSRPTIHKVLSLAHQ